MSTQQRKFRTAYFYLKKRATSMKIMRRGPVKQWAVGSE